jgi:hypothetical protein
MKFTWIPVVPAVQNGWTFAFAWVVFAAWLLTRRRDPLTHAPLTDHQKREAIKRRDHGKERRRLPRLAAPTPLLQCIRLDDCEVNRMIDKIIGWALLAFLIMAPTIAVFVRKNTAGAVVLAAAGAVALLLTRLPDISAFELFSLKIKLEKQSQQVEVTLTQLQKMATAFAQASLTELAMSGHILVGLDTGQIRNSRQNYREFESN